MRSRVLFLLVVLCIAAATQEATPPRARRTTQAASTPKSAAAQDEINALAADVTRMRSILRQMELNLGFLPAGQTPTKHQFELELDMWRALLDQMDRRLEAMRASSSK